MLSAGDQVPGIPLSDVSGKADIVLPAQTGPIVLNVGVTGVFTVIVRVVFTAHCPASGTKVYNVVARLFKAGDQLPVIPLSEVVGKAVKASPAQIGATALNVGIVLAGLTVTVKLVDETQLPELGVKRYVAVAALLNAGDQTPVIPFVEVAGKGEAATPAQTVIGLNVGITSGVTVIVNEVPDAHWPAVGKKL